MGSEQHPFPISNFSYELFVKRGNNNIDNGVYTQSLKEDGLNSKKSIKNAFQFIS